MELPMTKTIRSALSLNTRHLNGLAKKYPKVFTVFKKINLKTTAKPIMCGQCDSCEMTDYLFACIIILHYILKSFLFFSQIRLLVLTSHSTCKCNNRLLLIISSVASVCSLCR